MSRDSHNVLSRGFQGSKANDLLLSSLYHFTPPFLQIFGLTIFNFAFLIYAIIQISEIKSAFNELDDHTLDEISLILVAIIPGIISAAGLAYCYLSWHIYRLMGWEVFKRLGADRIMKVSRYSFILTRRDLGWSFALPIVEGIPQLPGLHLSTQIRCVLFYLFLPPVRTACPGSIGYRSKLDKHPHVDIAYVYSLTPTAIPHISSRSYLNITPIACLFGG